MNKNKERRECSFDSNNDDQVLKCCLHAVSTSSGKDKVMLLTDDINLQNKALVHKVETMTMGEFIKAHVDKLEPPPTTRTEEPKESDDHETTNPNKYRRSESGKAIPIAKDEPTKRRATLPSRPSTTNVSNSFRPSLPAKTLQPGSSDLTLLKNKLETKLIDFMISKLCQQYGSDDWKDVVPQFNPNNTSLVDCLRLIKQLWIAVFSQHFNRNKSVLKQIEELIGLLRTGNQRNVVSAVEALLKQI